MKEKETSSGVVDIFFPFLTIDTSLSLSFDMAIQLVKHVRRMYSYVNDFENKTGFIPTLTHKFSAKMHYAVALTSSQSSFYHLIAYSFYYDFSFTFIYNDPVYILFDFLLARRK